MTTIHPVLELELLNLATAATLARNGIVRTVSADALRDNPWHPAARLLRHLQALENALREYDDTESYDSEQLP